MTSLYDRLGGVYSIATVIDDFIDRIMVDPRLNANPKVDEAHHRVPPASRHGDGLLGRRRKKAARKERMKQPVTAVVETVAADVIEQPAPGVVAVTEVEETEVRKAS